VVISRAKADQSRRSSPTSNRAKADCTSSLSAAAWRPRRI